MAQLQSGSRPWPILGPGDEDWASFAYLWPNYVLIDHRNINNGTGSAADKGKVRKANLHSILALATQNNAQAREIIEERQSSKADEDARDGEPDLDGEADFTALREHFNPRLQVCVDTALPIEPIPPCSKRAILLVFVAQSTSYRCKSHVEF